MKNLIIIVYVVGSFFLLAQCNLKPKSEVNTNMTDNFELPEWAKSANIYEVNIRQYTPEGTFKAFEKHLPRLAGMGVKILWFMPIFPISEAKRKGSLGSYYAVSDFRTTNPKFGTLDDFKSIVSKSQALGMKVILDWVPNHTGWDHTWLKENPDFYTKDSMGNVTDPLGDDGKSIGWTDVADLNYDNQEMRRRAIDDMLYWINDHGIDGFRQDMALMVPLDFWKQAVPKLKDAKNDIFLLAESEVHDHLNQDCFHTIYGWSLHHTLNDIAQGKKNAISIDEWYKNEKPKVNKGLFMHFTSNHDENSWSGSEIERMGEAHKAFAVLTHTLDGIPLVYSGQEEPMAKRLEFFEKDDIEFKDFAYEAFYTELNKLKKDNPALWNGKYGGKLEKIMHDENVFAFERVKDNNKVTVIINLSKQNRKIKASKKIQGQELFTKGGINFNESEEISLKPWQYLIIY